MFRGVSCISKSSFGEKNSFFFTINDGQCSTGHDQLFTWMCFVYKHIRFLFLVAKNWLHSVKHEEGGGAPQRITVGTTNHCPLSS